MLSPFDFLFRPSASRDTQGVKLRLDNRPGPARYGRHNVRTAGKRRIHFVFAVELLLAACRAGTMPQSLTTLPKGCRTPARLKLSGEETSG